MFSRASMVEAEKKFRRVQGWRDIKTPITALRALEDKEGAAAERVAWTEPASCRSEKINIERDNPGGIPTYNPASMRTTILLVALSFIAAACATTADLDNAEIDCEKYSSQDESAECWPASREMSGAFD